MYESPHQFEPLIPSTLPATLARKSADVVQSATQLTSAAHPTARAVVRELVRSMNSYYSNRIEGQGTHPLNIERALKQDFSDRPDIARLQRLAVAHIESERELESLVTADGAVDRGAASTLSSAFLIKAHATLYARLPEDDRRTDDGHIVAPGQLRDQDVTVGRHIAPAAAALARFLARMDQVYGRPDVQPDNRGSRLVAIACAHHRAAWVHPFRDGNGRAIRLQSQCALWPLSDGLWSPSRGLARSVPDYYAHLANADAPRRGDLDGRGNLTTAGLLEWIEFFIDICADQVSFMHKMLDLDGMRQRIQALVTFRAAHDPGYRPEAILPLHHVFAAGPLTRREFSQLTGLGERTARTLMSHLLSAGLLVSDTPLGPVRLGLPLDALQFLLPELYPEAATSVD